MERERLSLGEKACSGDRAEEEGSRVEEVEGVSLEVVLLLVKPLTRALLLPTPPLLLLLLPPLLVLPLLLALLLPLPLPLPLPLLPPFTTISPVKAASSLHFPAAPSALALRSLYTDHSFTAKQCASAVSREARAISPPPTPPTPSRALQKSCTS